MSSVPERGLGPRRYRMRTRNETQLVNRTIGAYVGWREACRAVHDAYLLWTSATGPLARVAFWRYAAALDAEELAAEVYARVVRRFGDPATSDDDRPGTLAG
jgi:hypothetical protein